MSAAKPKGARERGRPPRVTVEHLRQAILSVRGREPTIEDLAQHLGVTKAAIYHHVKGQKALRVLATDTIVGAWRLEPPNEGMHWSSWALSYARALKDRFDEYPVLLYGLKAQAGRQLVHVDHVVGTLVGLGLDIGTAFFTYYALMSLTVGTGVQSAVERFDPETATQHLLSAIAATPEELPVFRSLIEGPLDHLATPVFDQLVWFTLQGIALRRGETLPDDEPGAP